MKKLKLWMTQWLVDIGSCLMELGDRMIWKGVDMGDDLLRDDDELLKYAEKEGDRPITGAPFFSFRYILVQPIRQIRIVNGPGGLSPFGMDPFVFPTIENPFPSTSVKDNLAIFQAILIPIITMRDTARSLLRSINRHGYKPSFPKNNSSFYEYSTTALRPQETSNAGYARITSAIMEPILIFERRKSIWQRLKRCWMM